ncbi:MAG TPA: TauD/TfdA family dioxygenase [Burkholderiales bacterium]|jgi:taurine dioxygenase|nr:TauD/TfdA family dioxygenase [Burkholderiales bacterium]
MQIQPLAGALGAEIRGVTLTALDDAGWREIQRAFLDYAVLVFRDQALEAADIMRVGGRFGAPCYYPFVTGIEGFPYIFEVVKAEEETTNFGGSWHSDTTYLREPPLATLLYALETPTHGGDTLFSSTRAAYDALSDGMREMLTGLVGVNSAGLKYGGGRSKMHSKIGGMKVHDTDSAEQYEAEHPVVRTHPDTGRKALYLSRSHTIRFKDMTEAESRPLIEFLQEHQTRPEFTCRVQWAPGTLTVWDNRCTQHFAVNDYHGRRRRMRRLTVGAQVPR